MDKFPLLENGVPVGELTTEQEMLYTWFEAPVPPAGRRPLVRLDRGGPWRAAAGVCWSPAADRRPSGGGSPGGSPPP